MKIFRAEEREKLERLAREKAMHDTLNEKPAPARRNRAELVRQLREEAHFSQNAGLREILREAADALDVK